MACVSRRSGLALLNSSSAPAPYESRDQYCESSGVAVMSLIEKNIRARDVVTRKSLENAGAVVGCTGGSTNAALHLPAIAHEAGIDFDLFDVADSCATRPTSWTCGRAGNTSPRTCTRWAASRRDEGAPARGLLHEDCITPRAQLGEELDDIRAEADGRVIFPVATPITAHGRRRGPQGQPRARRGHREGRGHVAEPSRSSPAPRASSTARRTPSRPSSSAPTGRARSW
jgi:dihydroxy-acid dehydratase